VTAGGCQRFGNRRRLGDLPSPSYSLLCLSTVCIPSVERMGENEDYSVDQSGAAKTFLVVQLCFALEWANIFSGETRVR